MAHALATRASISRFRNRAKRDLGLVGASRDLPGAGCTLVLLVAQALCRGDSDTHS
jgi:hypothetical protein